MALTDTRIRNAKPGNKAHKLSDASWLYLVVHPSGSKLWRMNYRFLGKQKTLAIGTYPEVSLLEAREKASKARKLLAQGMDPSRHKKDQLRAAKLASDQTFKALAKEFLATCERKEFAETTWTRRSGF